MSERSTAAPELAVIRDEVRAMAAYAVVPADGLVKLDAMENPFGLPAELAEALGRRLAQVALNRYPPAEPTDFKQRLARAMGVPSDMTLLLGNGSDELIHLVILACARPGAVVLSPWPSFEMYAVSAKLDGCRFVAVPLREDFSLDAAALLEAVRAQRPAVTFVSWPNNPTGNLFDREVVAAVIAAAAPGLVVIDEAYLPFAQDTWMPRLSRYPNLLVLRTLSKLGLAGIRLGYLAGRPAWLTEINKLRPPYNVNVLTLATAEFLLDHLAVLDGQAAALRAERARLMERLRQLHGVTPFESAANFVLLRVGDHARADAVFEGLRRRGILIKNRTRVHPLLEGCVRTTVGTPAENDRFLDALRELV
jgi:histidinol-phosphate aminotransferase